MGVIFLLSGKVFVELSQSCLLVNQPDSDLRLITKGQYQLIWGTARNCPGFVVGADRSFKLIFDDRSLCNLCYKTRKAFKKLSDIVITKLILFSRTFLCEQDFSVSKSIETKNRNRNGSLSYWNKISIYPWIHELIEYRRRGSYIHPSKRYTFGSLEVFWHFTFNFFSKILIYLILIIW